MNASKSLESVTKSLMSVIVKLHLSVNIIISNSV